MSSGSVDLAEWAQIHTHILHLEQAGLVTRTFRRLDPERQQAILAAILDEATERGPEALNIKRVAERANVSVGSLYTYFPNREGMLAFAVEVCIRLANEQFDRFRPYLVDLPLGEALEAYVIGGVEWSRMYAGLLRLFARAAYHGDAELAESLVRPIATRLREMLADMVAAGAERGELRADVDRDAVSRLIHALTVVVGDSQLLPYLNTYFQVLGEEMPRERLLAALLDLVVRGVFALPEP